VIALVGDGAMQMNNMAELITVQKYWKRWADPRWIVCVFNNQDLNEVTWEQRVMEGNPKFEASQDIPDFAYAKFGEMLGLRGIFVDSPDRLASAWQEALSSDRPVVLEVKTDPEVAPLPPHVTFKEARSFMSAMAKGDGGAGRVIGNTARQVVDGLFGKKD
jgi:pyruvate dehydrogenase (quinone)